MLHTTQGSTEYRVFDSMEELVRAARAVPAIRARKHDHTADRQFIGRDFGGDFEAVYRAAHEPWGEGIAALERMLEELDDTPLPSPVSRRRRITFREDDGDQFDYDRARSGQPCWRTTRRQNTRGPATVTVIIDVCASAGKSAESILWRGAAGIALARRLEEAGYRVELWAVAKSLDVWSSGRTFDTSGMTAVRLKAPSDPLDVATLVSAVSGWCFRTLWFLAWCMGTKPTHPALGSAVLPRPADLDQVSRDPNRILVHGVWTYDAAVALIRQTIDQVAGRRQ